MTTGPNVSPPLVVLVNGLPAAGKTTLARRLSRELSLPMFSKDVIKEAHADVFGSLPPDTRSRRAWRQQFGAAASSALWALLADAPGGAVLESTWPGSETWRFVEAGLASAQVRAPRQIWCEVPLAVAKARCLRRQPTRHPIHGSPPDDDEWAGRWAAAEPLPIPHTLRIATTQPLDLAPIVDWCRSPACRR